MERQRNSNKLNSHYIRVKDSSIMIYISKIKNFKILRFNFNITNFNKKNNTDQY